MSSIREKTLRIERFARELGFDGFGDFLRRVGLGDPSPGDVALSFFAPAAGGGRRHLGDPHGNAGNAFPWAQFLGMLVETRVGFGVVFGEGARECSLQFVDDAARHVVQTGDDKPTGSRGRA